MISVPGWPVHLGNAGNRRSHGMVDGPIYCDIASHVQDAETPCAEFHKPLPRKRSLMPLRYVGIIERTAGEPPLRGRELSFQAARQHIADARGGCESRA